MAQEPGLRLASFTAPKRRPRSAVAQSAVPAQAHDGPLFDDGHGFAGRYRPESSASCDRAAAGNDMELLFAALARERRCRSRVAQLVTMAAWPAAAWPPGMRSSAATLSESRADRATRCAGPCGSKPRRSTVQGSCRSRRLPPASGAATPRGCCHGHLAEAATALCCRGKLIRWYLDRQPWRPPPPPPCPRSNFRSPARSSPWYAEKRLNRTSRARTPFASRRRQASCPQPRIDGAAPLYRDDDPRPT